MVSIKQTLKRWQTCAVMVVVAVASAGCRSPSICCDPRLPARELAWRTSVFPERVPPCQQIIPAGVILEDGLSEDEAVQIALSNNSAFQATLAQLGMVHGDAVQASLLANPQFLVYFPTGQKEGQYTLFAPIESFLLRPSRVKIANREYRRVGALLVQNGLDLARDVRVAYADLAVAVQQAELATEALEIRSQIADVTAKRLANGDISELETITAKVDRLNAKAATGVQGQNAAIAEARLASLIGLTRLPAPLVPLPLESPSISTLDENQLIAQALACRPDYQAAKWTVAAAAQRSRLARWLFLRLDGVLDVRDGPGYTWSGGGLRLDVPIFNRNEGGIIRTDWEVDAASHDRDAIADQIVADVRAAARQVRQAKDNLWILEKDVEPALVDALAISQQGFAAGGTDYLLVLQTTTQYLDVRTRILDQKAAHARAVAELERAVGCHLEAGVVDIDGLAEFAAPDGQVVGEKSTIKLDHDTETEPDTGEPLSGLAALLNDPEMLESGR